jgi:hypothetical protein
MISTKSSNETFCISMIAELRYFPYISFLFILLQSQNNILCCFSLLPHVFMDSSCLLVNRSLRHPLVLVI